MTLEYEYETISRTGKEEKITRRPGRKKKIYTGQVVIAHLNQRGKGMSEKLNRLVRKKGFNVGGRGTTIPTKRASLRTLENSVERLNLEKEKYEAKVELEEAKKRLKNLSGDMKPEKFFFVDKKGRIWEFTTNPGEPKLIFDPTKGNKEEGKGKEKPEVSAGGLAEVIKATSTAIKTGIDAGKGAGVKGMSSDEVRKIVEDKIETYTTKMDAKFDKILAKIDKVIEGGGTKKDVVDTIKDLQDLGVIAKKREGEKGEGGVSGLSKTIKELEDAGLVVRATKVNQEAAKLEFEKEKEGLAFWLAARKLVADEKKAMMEERISREKIKMFKDFAKDIGGAIAEGLEESEEEAEQGEEEGEAEEKGKRERVIEESEKSPAGIETFACDAVIDGVKCGAPVSIPPEAQKKGERLTCTKCGSQYEYL